MGSEPGKGGPVKAPMVNTLLAYVYKPLRPLMEKINVTRESHRGAFAGDVMLPEGYEIEVVAVELNAPVHATFGPDGACYVTESGYKIDSPPRVVRIDVVTGATETFFELPADRWRQHGAMTGGCWLDDTFYFANNDTISRIGPGGVIEDVVTGLPWGDHMPSYPIVGPDGSLYFTVGSVTNAGVVGADNFTYEWLRHSPEACDIPGQGRHPRRAQLRVQGRGRLSEGHGAQRRLCPVWDRDATRPGDPGTAEGQRLPHATRSRYRRARAGRVGFAQRLRHRLPPGRAHVRDQPRHRRTRGPLHRGGAG